MRHAGLDDRGGCGHQGVPPTQEGRGVGRSRERRVG
jgi:hypothetical protein